MKQEDKTMRDKVKRFLSILMTALMLVNLMPVGALAEGMKLDSNSVQSRAQKPDGYPVFVFVEVQGNTDGLTMNSDKWFTLGMVKSMNDVTKPPKPVTGYQNNINGVTADDVTAAMTRYKPNESINLGGIRWKGFKSENGASDTYPAYTNQACWHLDGSIRIEDLQVDYTIRYVDENNKEIASSKKKTDKAGSWTKLEKEDIKDITGYTYTDRHDPMQKLVGGKDTVINVYYTTNSYKYKVEHYYDGEIDPSRTDTSSALYGSNVNVGTDAYKLKDGYEHEKTENSPLTIGTDESTNVIKVYYKKKTDLSYTVKYLEKDTDKVLHEEKLVENQTFGNSVTEKAVAIDGYTPEKKEETITIGTEKNEITFYYTKRTDLSYTVNYYWNGTTEKVADSKTEENQTFEDVIIEAPKLIDGYTPISLERQELTITTDDNDNTITFYYYKNVKLTANSDTLPYNGEEQSVSGYTCTVEEKQKDGSVEYVPWTGEKPLIFEGVSASGRGKDVNENGYPVTFNDTHIGVNDGLYYVNESQTGTLTITPRSVTLTSETASKTYDGTALEKPVVTVGGDGFVEGQVKEIKATGSVTNAGSVANTITFTPNKETFKEGNYAITKNEGTLTINKRSVLITSQSATKTYDGSALTRPAVTITGDGFVPGELAKAEATGSITKVGSTPNTIQYTTTGAFNAANYSIALSVGTLTVTEKPKPEPRRTFNLTINYVYQNGKRAAASYNRGGLKNGETFDITSPVIAGYTASETVVSGTIYNRDIKVTVIYTADGVNLDDYGVPLGLGNITMNVGDCFE